MSKARKPCKKRFLPRIETYMNSIPDSDVKNQRYPYDFTEKLSVFAKLAPSQIDDLRLLDGTEVLINIVSPRKNAPQGTKTEPNGYIIVSTDIDRFRLFLDGLEFPDGFKHLQSLASNGSRVAFSLDKGKTWYFWQAQPWRYVRGRLTIASGFGGES